MNYIQHYGLERKMQNGKYERFTDHHSWNSRHISANWSTDNLGLHAEHHQSASKHYPLLSQEEKVIEMPAWLEEQIRYPQELFNWRTEM